MDFLPVRFTMLFLELFFTGLFIISPVILLLIGVLLLIAKITSSIEKWRSYQKSLYFTFITALTVGYGTTVPSSGWGKFLSILSAFVGVILTGVIVSVALNSVMLSWQATHNTPMEQSIETDLDSFKNTAFSAKYGADSLSESSATAEVDSL